MKRIELCGQCAAKMAEGYRLRQLPRAVSQKVFCGLCQRKRYGASYQIERKERHGPID